MFATKDLGRIAFLAAFLLFLGLFPSPAEAGRCSRNSKKLQRKPWHKLRDAEKRAYLDAEVCLMNKPPQLGLAASKSRYDDLVAVHQALARVIHGTGSFLPWHRVYVTAHERLLREECGYTGAQPYWDETRDAGHFTQATIFDADLGFGGTGQGPDLCIADGPFAGFNISFGPGLRQSDHCISRFINDRFSVMATQNNLNACNNYPNYEQAQWCFFLAPHAAGHGGVAGTMADPFTSPGDPIFFLHHAWLDKAWWDWQAKDLSSRLTDMNGPNTQIPEIGFPDLPGSLEQEDVMFGKPDDPNWVDIIPPVSGDPGDETTLNHVINTLGLLPNVTIGEVMDIRDEFLCFQWV